MFLMMNTSQPTCLTLPCVSPSQGWLKVFAMRRGVVGIRGVKSGLYLCMSGEGLAYGAVRIRLHSCKPAGSEYVMHACGASDSKSAL